MALRILQHALAHEWVTQLRDVNTGIVDFRDLSDRLTTLLFLEATRDLEVSELEVQTPLEVCRGAKLKHGLVILPVLRAGLGMVPPILKLVPDAQVGHLGVERDHETALPRGYYSKIPAINEQTVMIVDPMLATGGSLLYAIREARKVGAKKIVVLSIVAAPEGVKLVEENEPEVTIHTAAFDRELNAQKYILPGLGDFGDRLMGT